MYRSCRHLLSENEALLMNEVVDVQRTGLHVNGPGGYGRTDRDSPAFAATDAAAVLDPVHLPVVLQGIDEPLLEEKLAFLFRDHIGDDVGAVVINTDDPVFHPQYEVFPDQGVMHHVPVGTKMNRAVLMNRPERLIRGIEGVFGDRAQGRLFPLKSVAYAFMGGAVDSQGFHLKPRQKVMVGSFQTGHAVSSPKPLPDEIDRPLDFAFHPGRIGRCHDGFEAVMKGQRSQRTVEFGFPRQLPDEHVFHPVVKDLAQHSAKVLECPDVAVQKRGQVAFLDQLTVQLSGKTQDHREQVKNLALAVRKGPCKLRPVHLSLHSGFRLKTQVGHLSPFRFQLADEFFDNFIPSRVSQWPKVVVHPHGIVQRVLFNPGLDIRNEWIKFALSFTCFSRLQGFPGVRGVFLDRSAVLAKLSGDPPVRKTPLFQADDIQCNLLAHHEDTPCRKITKVVYDRNIARSGTFSNYRNWSLLSKINQNHLLSI